jgi:radical SAM protein with 4Fe4S-binding SPASM domain
MAEREAYYSRPGEEGTSTYNVRVPSIYSVEVTSACNYGCDFCPRGQRPDTFLDVHLARTISERDLAGSNFIEFQLAGEPTLHKKFSEIALMFKGKVLTGMSTNGSSVHGCLEGLLSLDYLTISIDRVGIEHEIVRPGAKWDRLVRNIDLLVEAKGGSLTPAIDLQMIEFPGVAEHLDKLRELCLERGWDKSVVIRTVPDSFLSVTREHKHYARKELCLDPWLSVVVQADGDVTSCCFGFGKETIYGSLREQSLEEIWATSPELAKMREEQMSRNYRPMCASCYMRSPAMLHQDLAWSAFKKRVISQGVVV